MTGFLPACFVLASLSFVQTSPDFTGKWNMDRERSDDGEALILGGLGNPDRMNPEVRRTVERLLELGRALRWLDVRQSPKDFRLYDDANNVRIYYLDGKKHKRETPWGDRLETETSFEGTELHMRTDGKDLGEVDEIYTMEGSQLLYTVKIRLKKSKQEVVIRTYYDRAQE